MGAYAAQVGALGHGLRIDRAVDIGDAAIARGEGGGGVRVDRYGIGENERHAGLGRTDIARRKNPRPAATLLGIEGGGDPLRARQVLDRRPMRCAGIVLPGDQIALGRGIPHSAWRDDAIGGPQIDQPQLDEIGGACRIAFEDEGTRRLRAVRLAVEIDTGGNDA